MLWYLHLRYDIDQVSKKEKERRLARIEDCADPTIQGVEECTKKEERKSIYSSLLQ